MSPTHGAIVGGVVTVPDIDAALRDYRDVLGLRPIADGPVGAALAASWGCPASAPSRMSTLRPASGAHCFVRLVEQPVPSSFVPTTTYGWAAFELTVQDVFAWPQKLADSGFSMAGAVAFSFVLACCSSCKREAVVTKSAASHFRICKRVSEFG